MVSYVPDYVKTFIAKMAKLVQNNKEICPALIIAQSALETGWGRSTLCLECNNLFGIKATSDWKGETFEKDDAESYGTVKSEFRVYNSWEECIKDYISKIKKSYSEVIGESDYRLASLILRNKGYCTWDTYNEQINDIVQRYDLWTYNKYYIDKVPTARPDSKRTYYKIGDVDNNIPYIYKAMNWAMKTNLPISNEYTQGLYDLVKKFQKANGVKDVNGKFGLVTLKVFEGLL